MKPVIASVLLSTLLFGAAQAQDAMTDPKCGLIFLWSLAVQTQALTKFCGWERGESDDAIDKFVATIEAELSESSSPKAVQALEWKGHHPLAETPYNCAFDPNGTDAMRGYWEFHLYASPLELDADTSRALTILASPEPSSCL
jgi:hypothetical protein